jgi:hypothetical protein
VIEGFVCGDIGEGVIGMCSIISIGYGCEYIEKGIMKRAKNPARTSKMTQVTGKLVPLSSSICCFINYTSAQYQIGLTGAAEATTKEQNIPVYVTNCKKNL